MSTLAGAAEQPRQQPRTASLRQRWRYRFDNTMARGPIALIGYLFVASLLLLLLVTALVLLLGMGPKGDDGHALGFWDTLWFAMLRTLDSGTMGGDTGRWPFLFAMLAVTLGGIFIVSTLIGVLTSGIEAKLDELRKGRSLVVETGHTIILGWSPQIFSIVSELAIANANQRRPRIAILADRDKVEMEDELRARVGDALGKTRVICRSGSPMDLTDLEIVNPRAARAVIILAPEVDDPDTHVIKTLLAVTNAPEGHAAGGHVVAEIREPKNMAVARMVGRAQAELVLTGDLIARIAVQTSRQSGLSVVYTELLDFGGDEIYFHPEPALTGRTFGEALLAYEDSALIGLRRADGGIQLNPPADTRIAAGDKVIAISADDDTVRLSGRGAPAVDEAAICLAPRAAACPERTLILGWNRRAPTIISELDNYVAPGSDVLLVSDAAAAADTLARECAGLRHLRVAARPGDTTDRRVLEALDLPAFAHVIVLGGSDDLGTQEADARTLITLLHLRDMAEQGGHDFAIVSEMLDIRNRELAEVTRADDFIVSDKLVSLLLAQIAENRELATVFADLFDAEGNELYLKPAGDYVRLGSPVDFYTVTAAALRRGEVAVGYRLKAGAGDAARAYGVVVNPRKSEQVTFSAGDRVIVLAEE